MARNDLIGREMMQMVVITWKREMISLAFWSLLTLTSNPNSLNLKTRKIVIDFSTKYSVRK